MDFFVYLKFFVPPILSCFLSFLVVDYSISSDDSDLVKIVAIIASSALSIANLLVGLIVAYYYRKSYVKRNDNLDRKG